MPKKAKELSALDVKRLTHPNPYGKTNATFAVGGVDGLLLQITPKGGRSWILRASIAGKRRSIGLGGYPDVPLAMARERAREARDAIWRGEDPVETRKSQRAEIEAQRRRGLTFREAIEPGIAPRLKELRSEKHREQWRTTLETYAVPEIGDMLVSEIGVQDVLRVLAPIWETKTQTASRLRGRIETVLAWATVNGYRKGDNPAAWKKNLDTSLAQPRKVAKVKNYPALAQGEVAEWFADLQRREGMATRALEFLAMTAARSGEVLGATWNEIDLELAMWTIPAARMKAQAVHTVPLPAEAVRLLEELPRFDESPYVFPSSRGGMLSNMSMSALMRRMAEAREGWYLDARTGRPAVPHGLRSTFRDWAEERGEDHRLAEIALAHKVGSEVERAYRRTAAVERRRQLMERWVQFLLGETGAKVVQLHAEAEA
jgi:integrase